MHRTDMRHVISVEARTHSSFCDPQDSMVPSFNAFSVVSVTLERESRHLSSAGLRRRKPSRKCVRPTGSFEIFVLKKNIGSPC